MENAIREPSNIEHRNMTDPTIVYIKPTTGLAALNLRDLWLYRDSSGS
jgi:hypothetical protein